VIVPSAVTLPVNLSKGAAIDNLQSFSVTCSVMPISEDSQCAVTSQAPLRSGQRLLPGFPALPAGAGSDELPHAAHRTRIVSELRSITLGLPRSSVAYGLLRDRFHRLLGSAGEDFDDDHGYVVVAAAIIRGFDQRVERAF